MMLGGQVMADGAAPPLPLPEREGTFEGMALIKKKAPIKNNQGYYQN